MAIIQTFQPGIKPDHTSLRPCLPPPPLPPSQSLQRSAATSTKPVSNGLPQRPYSEASLDDCVLLDGPPLEGVDSDEEDGDQLAANGGPSKGAGKPPDSSKRQYCVNLSPHSGS